MIGYVQEERYTAGAGMRTTAGMQEVEQRRSSCRGAVRVSFARLVGWVTCYPRGFLWLVQMLPYE